MDIKKIIDTQKSFSCTSCAKSFERNSDYKRHERTHTGVRPHICEHQGCGKRFIQRSALTVHTRIHTGEKPHICEKCGKPFSDPASLGRHRKIHSGLKLYTCPYANCQKTFTRQSTMTRHKNGHTGTLEEAAISTAAALANHMGSNRGGRQRSYGEQYSNTGLPMSTISPTQKRLTVWSHSELVPLKSYSGEYQYIDSHLPSYVQGDYHMQGQQTPTTAPYPGAMRPTSHLMVYGPPSILESPANSERQSGSTVGHPQMSSVRCQSRSQGSMPSLSQSNAYAYPEPEDCQQLYYHSNIRSPQSTEPGAYAVKPRFNQEMWTTVQ